jgi:hypothetical protein
MTKKERVARFAREKRGDLKSNVVNLVELYCFVVEP